MNEAIDVILSCDDDPSLQEYYRQKEMAEIEEGILLAKAKAEGIVEGRTEGIAEGRVEERIKAVNNLYQMGLGLEDIQKAFGISLDEAKEILGL